MKKITYLVALLIISACQKEETPNTIPAYLKIDTITLDENNTTTNITDAWVYINDQLQGVYELPATFPVLKNDTQTLRIKAGIKLNGIAFNPKSPQDAIRNKIYLASEDRTKNSLFSNFNLFKNIDFPFLDLFSKFSFLKKKDEIKNANDLISLLNVKCEDAQQDIGDLSGGNQQKVVVARELSEDPILTIASQPTRGVDIGNIEAIHEQLVQMRDDGGAVLLVSAELDEVMAVADRVGVMYEGQIVKWVNPKEVDQSQMGLYMAGVTD